MINVNIKSFLYFHLFLINIIIKCEDSLKSCWGQPFNKESSYINTDYLSFPNGIESEDVVIPKIFHQLWFDFGKGSMVPEHFEKNTKRLLELHPGWKYKLWTEDEVDHLIQDNLPDFLQIWRQYDVKIKKHDSARPVILSKYGGVYLDHDFIPIKNIEPLLGNNTFVIANEDNDCMRIGNAFIGSIPKHPIFLEVLNDMYQEDTITKDVLSATGPLLWTSTIEHYLAEDSKASEGFTIYSPKYLYPCSINKKDNFEKYTFENIELIKEKFPECFLFQQFASTWWPDEYKKKSDM